MHRTASQNSDKLLKLNIQSRRRLLFMQLTFLIISLVVFGQRICTAQSDAADLSSNQHSSDAKINIANAQLELCQIISIDAVGQRTVLKLPNGRIALLGKGEEIPGTNTVITQIIATKILVAAVNPTLENRGYRGYLERLNNGTTKLTWFSLKPPASPLLSKSTTTEIVTSASNSK